MSFSTHYILIILIYLFTVCPLSAQENSCFWGLYYGMDKDSVEHKIKSERNSTPAQTINLSNTISVSTYFNTKIEGCTAKIVNLYFENNKLVSTEATFRPDKNIVFKIFIHLLSIITKQHGEPNAMNMNYINKKSVGGKRNSFIGGKIAIWAFPQPDRIYTINLMVTDEKEIKLDYIETKQRDTLIKIIK